MCVCVCVQDHPGYSVLITETGSSVVFDLEGCFESRVKSGNVISLYLLELLGQVISGRIRKRF